MNTTVTGHGRCLPAVALCVFILAAPVGMAYAQNDTPDIQLDGYRIVGRDTRVFTIIGDRASTVEFFPQPIVQPPGDRSVELSRGLIGEDERLVREESFDVMGGAYVKGELTSGSDTPAVLWGAASLDVGPVMGTARLRTRMSRLNDELNTPAMTQEIDASGYFDTALARFGVDVGFGRADEEMGGELFRDRQRSYDRLTGGVTARLSRMGRWDMSGRASIQRTGFDDPELFFDEAETIMNAAASIVGDAGSTTLRLQAHTDYFDIDGDMGSSLDAALTGSWLVLGRLGFRAGAAFFTSAMPDQDAEVRLYPRVVADWAVSDRVWFRARFEPGVEGRALSDIYRRNGLATFSTPMLYEDRKVDGDAELGVRFSEVLAVRVGGFHTDTDNALVFTTVTPPAVPGSEYFDVVPGAHVTRSGVRAGVEYTWSAIDIEGLLEVSDTSWNRAGNVPFMPALDMAVSCGWRLHRFWRLRGSARFLGEHHVALGSGATEDGFATVDIGVDRWLFGERVAAWVEVRNITDSAGAWWTGMYPVPGVGLYAGFRASY